MIAVHVRERKPILEYLVRCPCEHSLEDHGARGCARCACDRDQRLALDAAIDEAAKNPWSVLSPREEAG